MTTRTSTTPASYTPTYSAKQWNLWARILLLLALALTAFFVQLYVNGRAAIDGSYTAYLLVAPALVALIAGGDTQPPRGVVDSESDWIVAVALAVTGFVAIGLFSSRLPTLAGFWRVDQFGLVVWIGVCAVVIFSVRHVVRLWSTWLFALFCAPSLPYLLITAELGGSEDDAVLVAVALGSVAVYNSTRVAARPWRLLAAVLNFACAVGSILCSIRPICSCE